MSRRRRQTGKRGVPVFIWVLLGGLLLAAVYRFAIAPGDSHHPEPRADATAANVVSGTRFSAEPQIGRVYTMAAAIPNLLDGLYCYCQCSKHAGHRSLLTCFESEHGAGCSVCLDEAFMAYTMSNNGSTLDQIRDAIDLKYGG
jgi:hypothetical protein